MITMTNGVNDMTPNDIEILIHCHCCPLPHPRCDSPAVKEALISFVNEGLVYVDDSDEVDTYRTTPRGYAHLEQLCSLELPIQQWIDSNGKIIDV